MMARLLTLGAAAPLLFLSACAMPVAEAPPEYPAPPAESRVLDSPIDTTVRPWDLPLPPPPTQAELAAAAKRVRRLSPRDFPGIPPPIVDVLLERGCLIPQAGSKGPLGNLIKGAFFEAGRESWAVICSRDGRSQILAFRGPNDAQPAVVDEFVDPVCLDEEWNCGMLFGKNIDAVGREFIMHHHEMFGGPKPPPIDHHGIDVGIWEKGSVVRYFHNGAWLSLTGAD